MCLFPINTEGHVQRDFEDIFDCIWTDIVEADFDVKLKVLYKRIQW